MECREAVHPAALPGSSFVCPVSHITASVCLSHLEPHPRTGSNYSNYATLHSICLAIKITPHLTSGFFPHCECARVSGWAGMTVDWLPCPAVTVVSCARHGSHPSHKATVLGPPGLEWGLQEWRSAVPLLFQPFTKCR